ncbi:MAG: TGS domain-containing protein [Candidatus Njordarchaeales archaeon]
MPANLPAEAKAAYQKYLEAKTLEEKIRALEEFISLTPKHKGTEKLLMHAKKTLMKLKLELSKKQEIAKKRRGAPYFSIPKEGDVQFTLLGLPGVGKTSLFNMLTENTKEVGKTTILPSIGIFKYEGVWIQVIDLPPILSENIDETPNGRALLSIVRNSDIVGLVIDLSQDVKWQIKVLFKVLKDARIVIDRPKPPIRFLKLSRGGIQIYGTQYTVFSIEELKEFLTSMGIQNCILEIHGPVDEEDILNALDRRTVFKKAIVIATKGDLPGSYGAYAELKTIVKGLRVIPVSAIKRIGRTEIGRGIIEELNLIRIWTKKDGKIAERAIVLTRGATVKDAAERIHSDFVRKFKFAIVERKYSKIRKMRVGLSFPLEDGDVLTIYTD